MNSEIAAPGPQPAAEEAVAEAGERDARPSKRQRGKAPAAAEEPPAPSARGRAPRSAAAPAPAPSSAQVGPKAHLPYEGPMHRNMMTADDHEYFPRKCGSPECCIGMLMKVGPVAVPGKRCFKCQSLWHDLCTGEEITESPHFECPGCRGRGKCVRCPQTCAALAPASA